MAATFEPGSTGETRGPRQHPDGQTWETVMSNLTVQVSRLRVPGGWLYQTIAQTFTADNAQFHHDVTYVPDQRRDVVVRHGFDG